MSNINKTQESGRSMVEMLGVLAVIGVLSVTAIAGYKTAMDKHRANQILNAASVRAMSVSAKLQRNSELNPIPTEFSDSSVAGATFVESASSSGNNFTLTVNNVNTDVCAQITKMVDANGNVNISEDCKTFTYMHDLSAPVTITPTGPTGDECSGSCGAGAECVNGYCQCTSGVWNPSDNAGGGSCNTITNGDCTKNADCGEGEYCAIASSGYDCAPDTGTCTAIGSGTDIEYNGITFVKGGSISWWSARNWCLAQGKSLASLSDLGCTTSDCSDWIAIKTAFGSSYYWTSNSDNSCFAFFVSTGYGYVNYYFRNYYDFCALCK